MDVKKLETGKFYVLPQLPYGFKDLEPYVSEEQLKIHHDKHHQGYVDGANAILKKLQNARKESIDLDVKSTLKALSFNIGGHILHSLFWPSLAPSGKGGGKPGGVLGNAIDKEFGSFERFKKEFSQAAASVEGSGWATLTFCRQTNRLIIMQIDKHNTNIYPCSESSWFLMSGSMHTTSITKTQEPNLSTRIGTSSTGIILTKDSKNC